MCLFSSLAFQPLLSRKRLKMYEAEAHVVSLPGLEFTSTGPILDQNIEPD
jgi:hypothetical protein